MKTSVWSVCLLSLGSMLFASESSATTYAGQSCNSSSAGVSLSYSDFGATNSSSSGISISCPLTRVKDGGTNSVSAVIYFVNDGKTKTCFLDNFSIDTGGLGVWTSVSGVSRMVFPTLSTTLQWQPLTLNCSLPAGSKVNGYFLAES